MRCPARCRSQQNHVEARRDRGERGLHQQPRPAAEARAQRAPRGSISGDRRQRDLGSGANLEHAAVNRQNLLGGEALVQLGHALGDRRGVVAGSASLRGAWPRAVACRPPRRGARAPSEPSTVAGPSSMPGSTWQWRSIMGEGNER